MEPRLPWKQFYSHLLSLTFPVSAQYLSVFPSLILSRLSLSRTNEVCLLRANVGNMEREDWLLICFLHQSPSAEWRCGPLALALHPASEAGIFIYEHDKASYKLTRQVDTELQIKIKICRYSDQVFLLLNISDSTFALQPTHKIYSFDSNQMKIEKIFLENPQKKLWKMQILKHSLMRWLNKDYVKALK